MVFNRGKIITTVILMVVIVDLAVAAYAVLKGPIPVRVTLGTPMAYKNIYIHVPIAISTYIVFIGALVSSILYLRRGNESYISLADSYVKYGIMFGAATLVTGSAWASESWGVAWNWDPKQTAVLLLFLSYLAYFPLKSSIVDPDRANRVGAAYAIAAFVMVPISFLASRVLESLHPTGEAIIEFAGGGRGGILLGLRILLLISIAATLPMLYARGSVKVPKTIPLAILVAGVLVAGYTYYPIVTGDSARVVDATTTSDGRITSITLSTGETIDFDRPINSPINPPLTDDGQSTLIGHLVRVNGDGVEILYHWSTPFAFIVYVILLSISLYLLGGRR